MAYDPKDPADKKIVDALIAAAVAEAADEHETERAALVGKNSELLKKLKLAKEGKGEDPEEVSKLETQLDEAKKALKLHEKTIKDLSKERDTFKQAAEVESAAARKLIVDGGLTEALVGAGVKREFLPAVRRLLADQVTVKVDGDNRTAVVGEKPLGDFVKSWAAGEEGKNYVVAQSNGGANAVGGKANGSGGVDMSKLSPTDRLTAARAAASAKA